MLDPRFWLKFSQSLSFQNVIKFVVVWHAEYVIIKTYKLTQFTDNFGSCLDKSHRVEKQLLAVGHIVS